MERRNCVPDLTARLTDAWAQLATEEREVLCRIADRLLIGQTTYGKLDVKNDPRDFAKETGEELYDALVYATLDVMKKEAA